MQNTAMVSTTCEKLVYLSQWVWLGQKISKLALLAHSFPPKLIFLDETLCRLCSIEAQEKVSEEGEFQGSYICRNPFTHESEWSGG